jgi:hypothetical protein
MFLHSYTSRTQLLEICNTLLLQCHIKQLWNEEKAWGKMIVTQATSNHEISPNWKKLKYWIRKKFLSNHTNQNLKQLETICNELLTILETIWNHLGIHSTDGNNLTPPATTFNHPWNHLKPPATTCNHPCKHPCKHLQPPASTCNHLQPPAPTCKHLQPPANTCKHLQPPTTTYNHLQPPTTTFHHLQQFPITCYHSNLMQPLLYCIIRDH